MLRSLLKWSFFAAVVLLLGQVHVGGDTVGARFQEIVAGMAHWSGEKLKRTELFSNVSSANSSARRTLSEWIGSLGPKTASVGRTDTAHPERPLKRAVKSTEEIPASDRESLLRLLQ